jgi:predicted small lipoprotein YifL
MAFGPKDRSVEDMFVSLTPKSICTGFLIAGLCLGLGAGLGACGVRGSLDPPPSAKVNGTAKSAEASGTQPNSAAPPKPHEGFILDPLLR